MTRKESDFVRGKKKGRAEALTEIKKIIEGMFIDNHTMAGWNYCQALEDLKSKLKQLEGKSLLEEK